MKTFIFSETDLVIPAMDPTLAAVPKKSNKLKLPSGNDLSAIENGQLDSGNMECCHVTMKSIVICQCGNEKTK